jgi:hypothetical protein
MEFEKLESLCKITSTTGIYLVGTPELSSYKVFLFSDEGEFKTFHAYFWPYEKKDDFIIGLATVGYVSPWWEDRTSFVKRARDLFRNARNPIGVLDAVERLERAVEKAKSARFEFGENGQ